MKKKVLSIILSALVLASTATMFTGCGKETATPDEVPVMATVDEATTEVTTEPTEATNPTVSEEVKEAVKDNGLKVNDKGEVVDAKGNKVEVKDGKVEVTTDDGKKVTVKVDEVKEVTQPTKGSSSEPKETVKPTQKATQKATQPATKKPSVQPTTKKPATPTPKPTKAPTQKPTEKVWVKDYKIVHHPAQPAVTETIHHPAETHEEPIYKNTIVYKCNQCGGEFADSHQLEQHFLANLETCWSYRAVKKQVQTGTTTVVDKEAWDEVKVITPAKPAWDEKVEDGGHWEYK